MFDMPHIFARSMLRCSFVPSPLVTCHTWCQYFFSIDLLFAYFVCYWLLGAADVGNDPAVHGGVHVADAVGQVANHR